MGKETLKDKVTGLVNSLGWKLFCWTYPGGEKRYLDDIYQDASMRLNSNNHPQRPNCMRCAYPAVIHFEHSCGLQNAVGQLGIK